MSVAIRTVTDLQYLDDVNVTLGAEVDGQALVYDHASRKFVLALLETAWYLNFQLANTSGYIALII